MQWLRFPLRRTFSRLRGAFAILSTSLVASSLVPQTARAQAITITLKGTGAEVTGDRRVIGEKRVQVTLTGYNPLNPSTYQITVAEKTVAVTAEGMYDFVRPLLKLPNILSTPTATEAGSTPTTPPTAGGEKAMDKDALQKQLDSLLKAGTASGKGYKPAAKPASCDSRDYTAALANDYTRLRGRALETASKITVDLNQLAKLRSEAGAIPVPLLAERETLKQSVKTLSTALGQPWSNLTGQLDDQLNTAATETLQARMKADSLAEAARGAPCAPEKIRAQALRVQFDALQKDIQSIVDAKLSGAANLADLRGGVNRWQALLQSDDIFTTVTTLNPPEQTARVTITVQRTVRSAPGATEIPTTSTGTGDSARVAATASSGGATAVTTTLATAVLHHEIRPTVAFSAGALLVPFTGPRSGYFAPTYAVSDVTNDSTRALETEQAKRVRIAPAALAHIRIIDWLGLAVGGTLTKGEGTGALSFEPFYGVSVVPTWLTPNAYFTLGSLAYRSAVLRDGVSAGTTYAKKERPDLFSVRTRQSLAVAMTWRIR
jgi:hypothetical protein